MRIIAIQTCVFQSRRCP